MRRILAALLAALLLLAGIAPAFFVSVAAADGCPAPPPFTSHREPDLTIRLAFADREVVEGGRLEVAGQALWPSGRPVYGLSPDNIRRINAGEPILEDCSFEGGIVTLGLHLPLAPDGAARAVDPFVWTVTTWRGEFVIGVPVPFAVIVPGEDEVWAEGKLTVTACDRPAQLQGILSCAHTTQHFDVIVRGGAAPFGVD